MRCKWQFFGGVNAVQRSIRDARMPEQEAWRSAQVRRHRHAVECRLRHRLTLCHGPYRRTLLRWLWRDVLGEEFAAASVTASRKSLSLWERKRHQSVVHAWFLPQTSVPARSAHSAEDCRRHALFMTTSSNEPSRTERARVALACAWMQLLKLRKTATSQGCK